MARVAATGLRAQLSSLAARSTFLPASGLVAAWNPPILAPVCWYMTTSTTELSSTRPANNTSTTGFHPEFAKPQISSTLFPSSVHALHSGTASLAAQPQPAIDDESSQNLGNPADQGRHDEGYIAPHPGLRNEKPQSAEEASYMLSHPVYTKEYVESITPKHKPPVTWQQKLGYYAVQTARGTYDGVTGYGHNKMTEAKWLQRILFLETVAGVPGMVAGMLRHMRSLRSMKRDHGWIHTLLEEAENERMHLLTFLQVKQPGLMFRGMVLLAQGVFFNLFFLAYLVSPKICHNFVGYLEEEAVKTYTHALHDIDHGLLPEWNDRKVPDIAINYWRLPRDASMRDLILAVRADEACHGHVNHTFAGMPMNADNPFSKESHMVA